MEKDGGHEEKRNLSLDVLYSLPIDDTIGKMIGSNGNKYKIRVVKVR